MSTDYESLVGLLQLLPEPAIGEVADFAAYLFRKHVRLAVDERAARRKANSWLVTWVGNMVMAEHAQLRYTAARPIWRLGAFVTSLARAPRGPIGYVDVDALTGEVLNSEKDVEAMQRAGEASESSLSPSA